MSYKVFKMWRLEFNENEQVPMTCKKNKEIQRP
jgi:hypothetical protein